MGYFDFLKTDQASGEQNVSIDSERVSKDTAGSPEVTVTAVANAATVKSQGPNRRFSLRSLNFTRRDHNTALPAIQEQEKLEGALTKRTSKVSKLDKRAMDSALALRSLIVGPISKVTQTPLATAKSDLTKVRSQLLKPETANKIITQLRELPASEDPSHTPKPGARGPIHAVCLAYTDAEADSLHFSKLIFPSGEREVVTSAQLHGVISASADKLSALFKEMHIINLVSAPDLGLGQPGDGEGILAGALPTAETVIDGVIKITPELMALGFATGKAIMPDHSGIYPPTDRMSVLTYWWGLELLLPPPTLGYLSTAQSITNAVMNFLSALALINDGVREILPFIRYIAQFVDFEFTSIRRQDMGEGVVCAATWLMPAALVPRPWDFPTRPQPATKVGEDKAKPSDDVPFSPSVPQDTPKVTVPSSPSLPQDASKVTVPSSPPLPQDIPKVTVPSSPSLPQDTPKLPVTSSDPPIENPTTPQPSVIAA